MFHLNGKICRNKYHPERRTYDIPLSLIYYFLGIGFIQQTTNMHTVGAVHERPGSTQSVFRIRLGAFAGRGLCRRAIRESPLRSYREACWVKPIPIFLLFMYYLPEQFPSRMYYSGATLRKKEEDRLLSPLLSKAAKQLTPRR